MMNYQMNPYQNNYHLNPYSQMQNVYQPSYPSQPQSIYGKIVEDFNLITANDVPMNGEPATFLKRDMSEIQLRAWNANGQIQTISFKPTINTAVEEKQKEDQYKSLTEVCETNFANIYDRFDKLEKAIAPKTTARKVKSEDE